MTGGEHFIGPYRIEELLGQGSMGRVYRARRRSGPGPEVALKSVRFGARGRTAAERLAQERELLSRLQHPNVAAVLDAGVDESGTPYLVMELMRGPMLLDYCEGSGADIDGRIRLFLDVCRGVRHAHQKGIVHRDLKPANVLVAEFGGVPQPKVIDFGVAASIVGTDEHATDPSGGFVGTLDYMAPELFGATAHPIEARSDVYSLGVMLYELLVGEHPYRERRRSCRSLAEVPHWLRELEPGRPSVRKRELGGGEAVPPELDAVVLRAMAAAPDRRHPSVDALIEDLELYLAGEMPRTRAPGWIPVARRFVVRHRWVVGTAALLAATLLTTIVAVSSEVVKSEARFASALASRGRAKQFTGVLRADELVALANQAWPRPGGLRSNREWCDTWLRDARSLVAGRPDAGEEAAWQRLAQEIEDMTERREVLDATWPLWARVADWLAPHVAGRRLPPQDGLIPLGPDLDRRPRDGEPFDELWVFAVGGTGRIPRWLDADGRPTAFGTAGRAELAPDSALLLVLLPGGTFVRGSQSHDPNAPNFDPDSYVERNDGEPYDRESPPLRTSLGPYFIGKTEVTNHHYHLFQIASGADEPDLAADPVFGRDDHPVVGIRWAEGHSFCLHFGLELPTEAHWEFAVRAGTDSPHWLEDAERSEVAWFEETSTLTTHPVATTPSGPLPNYWGLHNVLGNVSEFCLDPYIRTLADARPDGRAPTKPPGDGQCVLRGGEWCNSWNSCRSAFRRPEVKYESTAGQGMRPARPLRFD